LFNLKASTVSTILKKKENLWKNAENINSKKKESEFRMASFQEWNENFTPGSWHREKITLPYQDLFCKTYT